MLRLFLIIGLSLGLCLPAPCAEEGLPMWWPKQKTPAGVIKSPRLDQLAAYRPAGGAAVSGDMGPEHTLLQSLAGLAAQAVNAGTGDELVWIDINLADYREWFRRAQQRIGFEDRGTLKPWELVERYQKRGLVKGYVLYQLDTSAGELYSERAGSDPSLNVATVVAGLEGGILVEASMEAQAKALGLTCLMDARGKSEAWCFDTYRDRLRRDAFLLVDPKVPHERGLAMAARCMVAFGNQQAMAPMLAWLDPLSPILGWGCGDEGAFTRQASNYGHFMVATNWCINETVLSAGAEQWRPKRPFTFHIPTTAAVPDSPVTSFLMSDGDNIQWMMGAFAFNRDYWAAPQQGSVPVSWTTHVSGMAQIMPDGLDYLIETQPAGSGLVEYGSGYHYPDEFGTLRSEPDLLARHARRVNPYLQALGIKVFGFLVMDLDSEAALAGYATYARELDGLTGMVAVQYAPYEGGEGKVIWVRNRQGELIPVVTARYSLWTGLKQPGAGDPAKIAGLLNDDAASTLTESWTVVHAWSDFGTPGSSMLGVAPVVACKQQLRPPLGVVGIDELVARIRARGPQPGAIVVGEGVTVGAGAEVK